MHAHLKAGWTYSEYTGACGGWELAGADGLTAIACKDAPRARTWQAFVVRYDDGATLFHGEYPTRADAMAAAAAAQSSDVIRRAAISIPINDVLVRYAD